MAAGEIEYFGNPSQIAVLKRGRALFDILESDERISCHGRVCGVVTPKHGSLALIGRLAHLQGASHYANVASDEIEAVLAGARALGLDTVDYARWEIHADQFDHDRHSNADPNLPDGITVTCLTPETPEPVIRSFAETSLACGVLPAWRSAHTGQALRSRTLIAVTPDGQVVSSAYATSYIVGTSELASNECFWGMLATHPDWRGKGLSVVLGSLLLEQMHKEFGFTRFYTGIEPGNTASEAVCSKIGLTMTSNRIVTVADASQLPGGRMTK